MDDQNLNQNFDEEPELLVFTDDDGNDVTVQVLDYLNYNGEEYAVLAEQNEEVTPGFASVAAVVRDHTGYPAAAVAVTFDAERLREDERPAMVAAVRRTAAALERRLIGPAAVH